MMQNLPKNVKRAVRELSALAYERELSRELTVLLQQFQDWTSGSIDAFQLSQRIHEFHQGAARELFCRYENNSMADLMVARAIVDGIVDQNEVPVDAREHLQGQAEQIRTSLRAT